jgi:hypothetical protein
VSLLFTMVEAIGWIVRILRFGFTKRWAPRVRLAATTGILPMNVSSVSSPTPPTPITPVEASDPKTPQAQTDSNSTDASTAQPTPPAPLPPGQGTRVNQLV